MNIFEQTPPNRRRYGLAAFITHEPDPEVPLGSNR